MVRLSYVFVIFFVTLGPLKTIPAFFKLTRDMSPQDLRHLAARGTIVATGIVLLIALVVRGVLEKWKVSVDALLIAGGILLLISSIQSILQFSQPGTAAGHPPDGGGGNAGHAPAQAGRRPTPNALAVTPLAVPAIVTPTGMVAVLVFMDGAVGRGSFTGGVLGLLLLAMALNWLGMFFARPFMRIVGVTTLQVVGWIFAVLQAGLAVEMMLVALRHLGAIPAGVNR